MSMSREVLLTVLCLLFVPQVFAQTYSSSIAGSYRVSSNVTYLKAGAWEAKLDIYSRSDVSGPNPTLVWFHGGDSMSGAKETQTFNLLPYLEWGWNVVNVEHRFAGVTLAPAAMQNGLCALRWIVHNAKDYGFDTEKMVVSGASSGGWFALTTAMAPRMEGWDALCPGTEEPKVAAVVNWFGVADLGDVLQGPNMKPYAAGWVRNLANPLEVAKSVSPLTFVRSSVPPVISIHGDADPTVPYTQSVRLHQALKRAGVAEEMVTIPGGRHGGFTRSENQKAYAGIEAFLAKQGISTKKSSN